MDGFERGLLALAPLLTWVLLPRIGLAVALRRLWNTFRQR